MVGGLTSLKWATKLSGPPTVKVYLLFVLVLRVEVHSEKANPSAVLALAVTVFVTPQPMFPPPLTVPPFSGELLVEMGYLICVKVAVSDSLPVTVKEYGLLTIFLPPTSQ